MATKGQPTYLTLSSSGSTPWQITSWRGLTPFNLSVGVVSTGAWVIDCVLDDPSGNYTNTASSAAPAIYASSLFGNSSGATGNGVVTFTNIMTAWRVTANSSLITRVSALERGVS